MSGHSFTSSTVILVIGLEGYEHVFKDTPTYDIILLHMKKFKSI